MEQVVDMALHFSLKDHDLRFLGLQEDERVYVAEHVVQLQGSVVSVGVFLGLELYARLYIESDQRVPEMRSEIAQCRPPSKWGRPSTHLGRYPRRRFCRRRG